ncbi:hypothetical protein POM88_011387 [Heracleum sosnowskyi]|uniref:Uncharacterized protein n=1 Tax=Heracleum sosnowskyi TaxID=360622 RepID=A0AAD8IVD1_9APIA|nr:hypothetical protein POM88_011387 [Heracleum sosnowskyi]
MIIVVRRVDYLWNLSIKRFKEVSVPESCIRQVQIVGENFRDPVLGNKLDEDKEDQFHEHNFMSWLENMMIVGENFRDPVLGNKLDEDKEDQFHEHNFMSWLKNMMVSNCSAKVQEIVDVTVVEENKLNSHGYSGTPGGRNSTKPR